MKSKYIAIFIVFCLLMRQSLAFDNENEEPHFDEKKIVEEYKEKEKEKETKSEGTSSSTVVLGGIGATGVAFALAFGYKNYKKNSEFNKFKQEIFSSANLLTKQDNNENENEPTVPVVQHTSRKISFSTRKNSKETIIQMQPLLSESKDSENYALTKNRAYKCLTSWTPQNSDEIILRRGDLICVKECFNDGYTLGRNLSTKFDGIFPTCCLARAEQKILGHELIKNGKFTLIPRRATSKNKFGKRARRASRGISILPGWNSGSEISSLIK